jgi:hypothetical protein
MYAAGSRRFIHFYQKPKPNTAYIYAALFNTRKHVNKYINRVHLKKKNRNEMSQDEPSVGRQIDGVLMLENAVVDVIFFSNS